MTATDINNLIREHNIDTNLISDGYHTFGELYDHRIILYIDLCLYLNLITNGGLVYNNNAFGGGVPSERFSAKHKIWKSKVHSDGSIWDDWFLLGIDSEKGKQITYHLPMKYWFNTGFAEILSKAPEFDGHSSSDVLERLKGL